MNELIALVAILAVMLIVVLIAFRYCLPYRCEKYPECRCAPDEECFADKFRKRREYFTEPIHNPKPKEFNPQNVINTSWAEVRGRYSVHDIDRAKQAILDDARHGRRRPSPTSLTDEQLDRLMKCVDPDDDDREIVERQEPDQLPPDAPPSDDRFGRSSW